MKCVVLNGGQDAFVAEAGKRASFLSHIAEDDAHDLGETPVGALLSLLRDSTKTIVCVIDGQVAGGLGLEFIMSCDYRVCSSSSEFVGDIDLSSTVLSAMSMPYVAHASRNTQKSVADIMHALLSGGSISATAAKDISLIDELVDAPDNITVATHIGLKHRKRRRLIAQSDSRARLVNFLPDQFLLYRSSQLFNLIRDYPSSLSALEELRTVLQLTCQYDFVIESIKAQLKDRLLIPGAHTEDILQMYLRTNKVVSLLFKNSPKKRSEVFQRVTGSVIAHLHKRKDSVKCIVSTMLEKDNEDEEMDYFDIADHCETDEFDWVPLPVDAKKSDETISLLIGVYGGQTHFLGEYREMLATRLVSLGSFEIDREIASLDLMKSKFDPDALNECSIMIKDMVESRKVFQKIKTKLIKTKNFHLLPSSLILSKHFWPSRIVGGTETGDDDMGDSGSSSSISVEDQFKFLPVEILSVMKEYEKLFTEMKPTQRLEWKRTEGIVVIQVSIRGREFEFRVSPLYVEVLSLFQSLAVASSASSSPIVTSVAPTCASSLTIEEIAKSIKEPNEKVRQIVAFWISKNVLREIDINKYVINE